MDVYFANANTGATYNDVQSIINDEDDTDVVSYTIYEVVEPDSEENGVTQETDTYSTNSWDPPVGSTHKYETTKTVTKSSYVAKDEFVISVVKGETAKLTEKYKGTLTGSISGKYFKKSKLGIKLSISCVYSTEYTFTGPTSGKVNSREYRVKYYRKDGEYVQRDYCYKPNGKLYGIRFRKGTYKEPVKYAMYSKDHKLE
ncbi:MAG: hypothetical protein LUF92_15220 [Clostridiales bacterium]|nr:hypothetical protein [Clostridiales bacterium]